MRIVRSRLRVLIAERATKEGRSLSLRRLSRDSGASLGAITRLANNTIREVPLDDMTLLCWYLGCEPGDILHMEEVDDHLVEALRQRAAKKSQPQKRPHRLRRRKP
jgi:DNA-binding Xre family transcriptional regulator